MVPVNFNTCAPNYIWCSIYRNKLKVLAIGMHFLIINLKLHSVTPCIKTVTVLSSTTICIFIVQLLGDLDAYTFAHNIRLLEVLHLI